MLKKWINKQQAYLYLQNHQQVLLTSISILLLVFCRQISGYFSNYDINHWFDYFIIVERLSMLFLLLATSKYLKEESYIVYELLLFFLLQDFIDRVFFNIGEFNINDIICLTIITIKIYVKFKK